MLKQPDRSVPQMDGPANYRIRCGLIAPIGAFSALRYRGRAYWIDDADSVSKRTIACVSLLLTVTEPGDSEGPPLVITTN